LIASLSKDAAAEKITRGELKSKVDHALNRDTVVVLDSLNYIKGFRYQLYCMARAETTQNCVVRGSLEQMRRDEGMKVKVSGWQGQGRG